MSSRNTDCKLCPRSEGCMTTCLWGIGASLSKPRVMFLLDSPNKTADFRGQVMDSDLYTWMRRICDLTGLRMGIDTYTTYAVKCGSQDRKNKPKAKEISACRTYLWKEIEQVQPQTVICMGSAAIKAIWGKKAQKLKQVRLRVQHASVKTENGVTRFKVSATYSPRIMADAPQMVSVIASDIRQILGMNQQESVSRHYTTGHTNLPILGQDVGFDIETEGFNPHDRSKRLLTAAISTDKGRAHGVGLGHPEAEASVRSDPGQAILDECVSDPTRTLYGHSIKFDLLWWTVRKGPVKAKIFDTKVAHSLLDENSPDNSLKYLAATLTDLGHYGDEVDRKDLVHTPIRDVLEYNNRDADASLRVGKALTPALHEQGLMPLFEFLMQVEKTLVNIEAVGVHIDRAWALRHGQEVYAKTKYHEEEIFKLAGKEINLDSPDQKVWFLYEHMGLPVVHLTKNGQPSTDKTALVELRYVDKSPAQKAATEALGAWSKGNKLWKGYYAPLPGLLQFDCRVHTTYNLGRGQGDSTEGDLGSKAGRLSSSGPNLQNIPIDPMVKGMFAATDVSSTSYEQTLESDWELVCADYSQLELRVGAYLAQAYGMIKAFEEGKDFHTVTLAKTTGMDYDEVKAIAKDRSHPLYHEIGKVKRTGVKRVNFGVFYGIGYKKLARQLHAFDVVMQEHEVKALMEWWFTEYHEVATWIKKVEDEAIRTGKSVTPTGRIRHLVGASRATKIGLRLLRQAVNTPVQSFASEICLAAMMLLDQDYHQWAYDLGRQGHPDNRQARIVLQVHDMIGIEYNKRIYTREFIVEHMRNTMEKKVVTFLKDWFGIDFNVPLVADIEATNRWA